MKNQIKRLDKVCTSQKWFLKSWNDYKAGLIDCCVIGRLQHNPSTRDNYSYFVKMGENKLFKTCRDAVMRIFQGRKLKRTSKRRFSLFSSLFFRICRRENQIFNFLLASFLEKGGFLIMEENYHTQKNVRWRIEASEMSHFVINSNKNHT